LLVVIVTLLQGPIVPVHSLTNLVLFETLAWKKI